MIAVGAIGRIGLIGSGDRGSPEGWPTWADLPKGGPIHSWDMLTNEAWFDYKYRGALANTPGWTFTRASTGYAQTAAGVLVPFASGELRRTDKGVLIEGARTNLCLQSQTLGTTWGPNNASVQSDTASAPDGTTTADTLTENSASAEHSLTQSVTVSNATAYTVSVYAKYKSRQWIRVGASFGANSYAYFDIQNGVVGTVLGGWTSTISALSGGWYRCSITFTSNTTTGSVILNLASADGTTSYLGDGTSGLYIWGAQLEAAALLETTTFPSSYIPTTTASATRAADVLTVPVTQASPLAAFAEFEYATGNSSDALNSRYALQLGTSSANRAIFYNLGDNGANGMLVQVSDEEQAGPTVASSSIASGVVQKVAGSVDTNNFRYAANGVSGTPDVSGTGLSDVTAIKFATDTTNQALYGYLRRAALWTRALTDAELQSLTT